MKFNVAFLLSSLTFSAMAFALPSNLQLVKPTAEKKISADPINCQQLVEKLTEAKQLNSSLGNNVTAISEDVARVMGSWYGSLSTYEGRSISFPYGYFDTISQSSNTSSRNAQVFRNDFTKVDSMLTDILVAMQGCLR